MAKFSFHCENYKVGQVAGLDKHNSLIIQYMGARLGTDNIAEAICHVDEGGLAHLHLDVIPITADNRLSSKTLITRDFITSVHNALPLVLQHHGFNVERGNISNEHTKAGRSAKEYKKAVDKENEELNKKLDDMTKEYNDLAEQYNNLLRIKKIWNKKKK